MGFDPYFAAGLMITAFLSAFAGLLALSLLQNRTVRRPTGIFADTVRGTEFLFDGENLVDATPEALALLPHSPSPGGSAWNKLAAFLSLRFPGVSERLARIATEGKVVLASTEKSGTPLMLVAEYRGGLTHISIADPEVENPKAPLRDGLNRSRAHV